MSPCLISSFSSSTSAEASDSESCCDTDTAISMGALRRVQFLAPFFQRTLTSVFIYMIVSVIRKPTSRVPIDFLLRDTITHIAICCRCPSSKVTNPTKEQSE